MALVPFPGTPSPYDGDPDDDESSGADKISFLEHLDELRKRLIVSVSSLGVGFVVSWVYIDRLVDFIFGPLRATIKGGKFQYTEPGEFFMLQMKLAALAGLFLALPVVLWQIWRFVAPGLYANEKKLAIPFVFLSTVFFTLGAAFSHFSRRSPASSGCSGVSSWTLGPICTSSPMVMSTTSSATRPKLTKTPDPTRIWDP